uniref:Uncharacterized protein n=1 Tax=Chromera velia CCMP2878 TaxID=1169474 RepID=A0A0G4G392_9ALVE|mmetsp:Transcript_47536/g.93779  ORF Transcript_47536/g.93779 Transcript_47536/m.93779 type:complete len:331 (-) Transcript_47536:70-1062(-)|eukprot:Cvel_19927.t1-p1 / transcript=Cvel_19927.t1 / gene=Cvel_19927 / organism=Chromera_velia_CCMP2878 / gene_product=hypothetical protein / transcript_product=hypothetical protein / location=Cvel_scaffold1753:13653-17689(-) / protein_length=330 / sequence_SO=supercontig / SO=protein_coding / is_pseudo=false
MDSKDLKKVVVDVQRAVVAAFRAALKQAGERDYEKIFISLGSVVRGVKVVFTTEKIRTDYYRCWHTVFWMLCLTIGVSSLLTFPFALVFQLIDLITGNALKLTGSLSKVSASLLRMIMDQLPGLAVSLIGFSLDTAFMHVLELHHPEVHSRLAAFPRHDRSLIFLLQRIWRKLRATLLFSLLLCFLAVLPGKGLVSLATAIARAAALTLFTGPLVAGGAATVSFFFPVCTNMLFRLLNVWRSAFFVNADVLDPLFCRLFKQQRGEFNRMVKLQRANLDLVLPFTAAWMLISAVPLLGPPLFLLAIPASAFLVPHMVQIPWPDQGDGGETG